MSRARRSFVVDQSFSSSAGKQAPALSLATPCSDLVLTLCTCRNNFMKDPGECRIVFIDHGRDIVYVPSTADSDNGNTTAVLVRDALVEYLNEHPNLIPNSWTDGRPSTVVAREYKHSSGGGQ